MTMWLQPQSEPNFSQTTVASTHGASPSNYSELLIEPPPSNVRSRQRRQQPQQQQQQLESGVGFPQKQLRRSGGNITTKTILFPFILFLFILSIF
jgi:hypothetical protein